MLPDEEDMSLDNAPMGQHVDDDPLPQILQDWMKINILEHAPATYGDHPCPGPLPIPPLEGEGFLHQQSQVPIYDGSPTCILKALVLILQFQVNFNISNDAISWMMSMICNFFLHEHLNPVLPKSHVELRKFMRAVGLGFTPIHCCLRFCILYYGKYKMQDHSPIYKEGRYGEVT